MTFNWSKRCGGCIHFQATVFKEESESGLGVWFGYCTLKPSERYGWLSRKRVLNMYHKCEDFEPNQKAVGVIP